MRPVLEGLLMTESAFSASEILHTHASVQMLPIRLRELWNPAKRMSVGIPQQSQLTLSLLNLEACLSINRLDLVESCPPQHFDDAVRYSSRLGFDYGQQGPLPIFPINMYLLKAKSSLDVSEGVKFFRAVLRTKCAVNLAVLLPAIGRIAALFLEVCLRAVNTSTYTGIIIPRSWARVIISSQETTLSSSSALLGEIIELFELLLSQLSTLEESKHLLYGTEDSSLRFCEDEHVRDSFMAQCLTYFCLLGYNLPDNSVIMSKIMSRLGKLGYYYPYAECSSIQRIFDIQRWEDIPEILCEVQKSQPFNEIIQIQFKGTLLLHPISGARRITYTDLALSDLKSILDEPPANIQPQAYVQPAANINQTEDTIAPLVSQLNSDTPALQDATTSLEVSPSAFLTESRMVAVATIENYRTRYRNPLQRLERARQEEHTLDHEFVRCLDYAQSNNLPQTYRIRFLGLLPLILFSLKAASKVLQAEKKANNKLLLTAERTALEVAQERHSFATATVKKIGPFLKQLDVDAELHSIQDAAALMRTIHSAVSCLEKVRQTGKGKKYNDIVNCLNLLGGVK
ncbi:hypothetical protein CPB83DRAFT_898590 [Crepidotus variabilis]|uniref:Uncharacterized protein n=1 Tax=Crepidotus variabilis TaxID=179855 RepID=A0A9P6E6X0_9AGAR|nr:hypothetical protein CPB83DRAFT_898590 [Crepidotus variabilis]